MRIINYVGTEGDCIVINRTTDVYCVLDWLQSRMIENQENEKVELNKQKWENAIHFVSELMEKAEDAGFGDQIDVDDISYQ